MLYWTSFPKHLILHLIVFALFGPLYSQSPGKLCLPSRYPCDGTQPGKEPIPPSCLPVWGTPSWAGSQWRPCWGSHRGPPATPRRRPRGTWRCAPSPAERPPPEKPAKYSCQNVTPDGSALGWNDFWREKKLDTCHVGRNCFRTTILKFNFLMLFFNLDEGLIKCWLHITIK